MAKYMAMMAMSGECNEMRRLAVCGSAANRASEQKEKDKLINTPQSTMLRPNDHTQKLGNEQAQSFFGWP
jgi:hypothetical protein